MPSRRKLKHATVVGVFNTRAEAEAALRDLRAAGFKEDRVGMVARNPSGKLVDENDETYAEEGAAVGAVAGAGAGALVGWGVLSGVVPVIGPAIALGTLGTILANAAGGAVIAGIAGALIGWGIPEEDAKYYELEVKAGRFLVAVDAKDREAEAWTILSRHGGYNRQHPATRTRATTGSAAGMAVGTTGTARTGTGRTMELKGEKLTTRKTPVEKGDVKVRKEVVTEHKRIDVPVEREEVVIERKPARGRTARGSIRSEEIRVPVKEERVDVNKEAAVNEKVDVSKRKVRGTKTVGGDVKREELRVEEHGGVNVRGAGSNRTRK
jgi:uncharacterized protein (TIGR02271 family)